MEKIGPKTDVAKIEATGTRFYIADSVVPGLRLQVAKDGTKSWKLSYRNLAGRQTRYKLGVFSKDPKRGLTLADARREAEIKKTEIDKGGDPQAEKQQARAEAKRAKAAPEPATVAGLALQCVEALPLRPSTRKEWTRIANKELATAFPDVMARDLTRPDVKAWARTLAKRGVIGNRCLSFLTRVFSWAAGEDLVEASPCVGVKKPFLGEESSERVLTPDELKSILSALDALARLADYERTEGEVEGPSAAYVDASMLLLLTGVRRSAAIGAKRGEFTGLDTLTPQWTIPGGSGGRSKSGRAHVVPLSAPAVEIVRRRLDVLKAIAAKAETREGECLFPISRLIKGKTERDRPTTWASRFMRDLKETTDCVHGSPLPRWKIHSFRASLATNSREVLKVGSDVVAAILGHTPPGAPVTRVYNRSELLDEKRAALVAWGAWLDDIKANRPTQGSGERERSARILPFSARA